MSLDLNMDYECILVSLFKSLWKAEKRGMHDLYPPAFTNLNLLQSGIERDPELSFYLLRCCFRVNDFFEGAFEISITSPYPETEFKERIGTHRLIEKIDSLEKLERLIEGGEFNPADVRSWEVRSHATHEQILWDFLKTVRMIEYRGERNDLRPLCFTSYRYVKGELKEEEIIRYLFQSCRRVNHFFKGTFEIFIKDMAEMEGIDRERCIGFHRLERAEVDWEKLKSLVKGGSFQFAEMESWECSPPMPCEWILKSFLRSLYTIEEKTGDHHLYPYNFKSLHHIESGLKAAWPVSNYLLKSCRRVNDFFPGTFEIAAADISAFRITGDLESVGVHRISDQIGDLGKVEDLIDAGRFKFIDSEDW